MNIESNLIVEIWSQFRDAIPASSRQDQAIALLRNFEEYGFTDRDMIYIQDEDKYLSKAWEDLYKEEDEEDLEYEEEDED